MKIICTGKDDIDREYYIHVRKTYEGYPQFFVNDEEIMTGNAFELILKPVDEKSYMIMMMNSHQKYGGFGIPDALIPFLAQYLESSVCSSPRMSEDRNYWRTDEATKVWERLVSVGKARYEKTTDIYHIV